MDSVLARIIWLRGGEGITHSRSYDCALGRSEKHKSLKCQNLRADYIPRHSPDFRTVFGIEIGLLVLCEIRQMCFTESKGRFDTMSRPDFKLFSAICKSRGQFPNHVTALISEQFLESGSDDSSCAKIGKRILQKAKAVLYYIK